MSCHNCHLAEGFGSSPQMSGSLYELPINEEDGYTFYSSRVLSSIIERSGEKDTIIERVKLAILKNE